MPPKKKLMAVLNNDRVKTRLTRLSYKLSSSPPPILSPSNMMSCSKLKQVGKVTKAKPDAHRYENQQSVGHSSSAQPDAPRYENQQSVGHSSSAQPDFAPMINNLTAPMPCSKLEQVEKVTKAMADATPNENQQSEGHSSSESLPNFASMINSFTAPTAAHTPPVISTPKVGAKTLEKTSKVLVDTVHLTVPPSDNVLNNKNKDTMVGGDASFTADSFVGRPPVTVSNANPTGSCGFTEFADMFGNEELSENEEESPSSVRILGKYSVKEALAPMITNVIEKYGDIAANSRLETLKGRSVALENLAEFIQTFKAKPFVELTENEIKEALQYVSELGGVMGLEVGWLQIKLEAILKARKMVKQSLLLKEKKDKLNQLIKHKKRSLEIIEEELKEKKRSLDITKEELSVAEAEAQRIKLIRDEVIYFVNNPPLGDLF
ncbi:hypothetical protein M5689_006970 [Euphorbia peplus]|nr:hypothetical protein M5689_006970 [Euphorbia peplus]